MKSWSKAVFAVLVALLFTACLGGSGSNDAASSGGGGGGDSGGNNEGDNDTNVESYLLGQIDTSFATSGYNEISDPAGSIARTHQWNSLAIDDSGNIYTCGILTMSTGPTSYDVVVGKFDSSGSIDASFGSSGLLVLSDIAGGNNSETCQSIKISGSGEIFIAGQSHAATGYYLGFVVKFNSSGVLDNTFDTDGIFIYDAAIAGGANNTNLFADFDFDSLGNLIVGGYGNSEAFAIRVTPTGSVDATYNGGNPVLISDVLSSGSPISDYAASVKIDSSGRALIGGYATVTGNRGYFVARILGNGSLDASFGTGGISVLENSKLNTARKLLTYENSIYLIGDYSDPVTSSDPGIVKFSAVDGQVDTSYGNSGLLTVPDPTGSGSEQGFSGIVDNWGNLYLAGGGGNGAFMVLLDEAGNLKTEFGLTGYLVFNGSTAGAAYVIDLAATADGKLIGAGGSVPSGSFLDLMITRIK